jgi:hypothetical protein
MAYPSSDTIVLEDIPETIDLTTCSLVQQEMGFVVGIGKETWTARLNKLTCKITSFKSPLFFDE